MTKKFLIRFFAVLLVIVGVSLAGYAAFRSSDNVDKNLVFADRTLLSGLWDNYKKIYWESGSGRTLDKQQNDITTSEGQSYTMLRAVWESDQATFDKTWEFTKVQLQREDKLFSWKWGQKPDGTYGLLTEQGGENTASDADSDIALALVMAASRWQNKDYLDSARDIIPAIWEEEVITAAGKPYLASNSLEKASKQDAVMNVSYFAPYAYRYFAKIDTRHDWNGLIDSSYELINKSIDEPIDKTKSVGLPPDWISLNKDTGAISAIQGSDTLTTNYGYDAMRTPWRLALDYKWNKDERAKSTLNKMSFLKNQWQENGKLYSTYSHDGKTVKTDEVAESYATALSYFTITDPEIASEVFDKKLRTLYDQNTNSWAGEMTYYGDNWTWFSIALHDNKLENLAADL
ncbi:hypothetical protein A2707_03665 [Candidatus Saccharibacteria bacterium RIFCSPHIGHO2_01_FULL_45_15]|nr:MAG: hypothetical protein A2707_03665 [Candidatus Saccharibacteria bacterium RIFCSPHIGHO2_01_FULL_45_15]OGL28677.1 MAG: hypothetical protein A3C39_05485 [Candidatus Saccharibacteria bacterium RIFCSPHIGHO2_02_FULL_46_12]OGL31480.1 MAG: hypothetical protein A3E76_03670 [Candidatus Saccharibacteria bacterium RIFCSPHIGHO2_12_FULL_44_22]